MNSNAALIVIAICSFVGYWLVSTFIDYRKKSRIKSTGDGIGSFSPDKQIDSPEVSSSINQNNDKFVDDNFFNSAPSGESGNINSNDGIGAMESARVDPRRKKCTTCGANVIKSMMICPKCDGEDFS